MYSKNFPFKRYQITIDFIKKFVDKNELILDLGIENPLSKMLKNNGYNIVNTSGEDLDIDQSAVKETNATVVTAFQIFEHLLNPFQLLMSITQYGKRLDFLILATWVVLSFQVMDQNNFFKKLLLTI